MPGLLDEWPVPWTDPRIADLRAALATAMYRAREIEEVVVATQLSPGDLNWDQPARLIWFDTLKLAADNLKLRQLLDAAAQRTPALRERIDELLADEPVLTAQIPADDPAALAPDDSEWSGFSGAERQIVEGADTLLDVSFLERGVDRARAVCRLEVVLPGGKVGNGTGFRIGPSLVLTNHHVLFDWRAGDAVALSVEAKFGYELGLDGAMKKPVTAVRCDPASIVGERAHDFAVIEAADPLPDVPVLSLAPKQQVAKDDRVVIVQHPNGLPKKIALAHNLVRHVDDDVVQYWTDTDEGSSGSPVFDERWEVVALHHYWVRAPGGDGAEFRNQGRNIKRVAERLSALGVAVGGG